MKKHSKFIIAIIAAFAAGVAYNIYSIKNGDANVALFGGPVVTVFCAGCAYYWINYFGRRKGKSQE
jgi:hypothetical protein